MAGRSFAGFPEQVGLLEIVNIEGVPKSLPDQHNENENRQYLQDVQNWVF